MKIARLSEPSGESSDTMRASPRLTVALCASAAVALAATLICIRAIMPLGLGLVLLAVLAWFSVPGVVLAWLMYSGQPGRRFASCVVGPIWGYGISSLVLLGMWTAGLRGTSLLVAPAVASIVAAGIGSLLRGRLSARPFTRADVVAVLFLLVAVPAIVGRPFAHVAEPIADGHAYRTYFTADMIWRMAVVAELSKGDVPPRNPFLRGEELRYYWLPHLLTAVEYQALRRKATLEQILLVHSVGLGLAFVCFLYGFARQWVDSPGAAAVGTLGALVFTSFEGLERLWVLWREGSSLLMLKGLNIDAVTRWFYGSLPIDGLQRLLWYQPHHSTGYALGLSALLVLAQGRDALTPRLLALCGMLLGLCLVLSTFSAIMLSLVVGLTAAVMLIREERWRTLIAGAIAGAAPVAAAVWIATELRYVDRSAQSLLDLGLNPMAVTNGFVALGLSFGPLLGPSVLGGVFAAGREASRFVGIAALVAVSFLFYFFVDVRDHQHVYVGWRAGHLLFVAFAVLTGYALQILWRKGGAVRASAVAGAALIALLSLPTFAIDFYNTQDITNRTGAAGFSWTLVLSHEELKALEWIKGYTAPDAIVQAEPHVRATMTWAYVPAFAERRMAAGLPISMVPLAPYQRASERVRAIYQAQDPDTAYERAAHLGIDYLLVGRPERRSYPDFEAVVRSKPSQFREVFHNSEVTIFMLEGGH
jgi:hypothetical protein